MEKKIQLRISVKEFSSIISLLKKKQDDLRLSMLVEDSTIPLIKTLTDGLDDGDRESFIRLEVKKTLSFITGVPIDSIGDNSSLKDAPLHMTSLQIRSLGTPFTHIARHFNPNAIVSANECEKCNTVNDCVTLISSKI